MAQFSRLEVAQEMNNSGLVPLFYHKDIDVSKNILKACYNGGARVFEFTARGDLAHEVFKELMLYSLKELPNMILGVGSITDAASAFLYLQIGANFIVTPVLREDVAIVCNRRKILWLPGCGTLTEIARAEELGCEIIKLFPGDIYGPQFVKGIKGPQPWTSIMPTGGVSPTKENLEGWFSAGVTCVGMGSKLMAKNADGSFDYAKIESTTKNVIQIIQNLKN